MSRNSEETARLAIMLMKRNWVIENDDSGLGRAGGRSRHLHFSLLRRAPQKDHSHSGIEFKAV